MKVARSGTAATDLRFSHSQFFVYDSGLGDPACEWTESHSRQGFARREGVVAIGTLLECGTAKVTLALGRPEFQGYERVVSVPLQIGSGSVAVDGPEETPGIRKYQVANGDYRATIGQRRTDDGQQEVTVWLEKIAQRNAGGG